MTDKAFEAWCASMGFLPTQARYETWQAAIAHAQQERKPMTLEEANAVCEKHGTYWLRILRATEAFHGIKETPEVDDGEGGTCTVCGGLTRYGSRHVRCATAQQERKPHTEAEVQEIMICIDKHLWAFYEPVVRSILGVPAPKETP